MNSLKTKKKSKPFFLSTLKDYRVGAFSRSSSFVVKKILKDLKPGSNSLVLEYGAGDGIITKEILKRMGPNGRLIAIETNEKFILDLKEIKDNRLTIVSQKVEKYLNNFAINENVDFIISGIPFTLIKPPDREKIVEKSHKSLKENGVLIVYQYSLFMKPLIQKYFKQVRISFEPLNFLPYFIMEGFK